MKNDITPQEIEITPQKAEKIIDTLHKKNLASVKAIDFPPLEFDENGLAVMRFDVDEKGKGKYTSLSAKEISDIVDD